MFKGVVTYLTYLFRKDRRYYLKLTSFLGFLPVNVSLYRIAFTHKSASFKLKDGTIMNNERLEYLGDALLGAIAAEFIYTVFDHMDEGYMTKLRSRIVKRKNLNAMAIEMGIPELVSSHPQSVSSAKHLYGNALEALIGAIYLDRGFRCASRFFRNRMINRHVDLASLAKKDSDYKSQLIEWAQKSKREVLFFSSEQYDTVSRAPAFEATVQIDMQKCGTGVAASKKEAEQQAAREALKGIPV
jgi:ribonuclease-3